MQDKEYVVKLTWGEHYILQMFVEKEIQKQQEHKDYLAKKNKTELLRLTEACLEKLRKLKQKLEEAEEVCE